MPEFDHNLLDNPIEVRQHFPVPEPHDPIPAFVEYLRTRSITCHHSGIIAVLRTINFNDQAALAAAEISDKIADRKLAAELEAIQLVSTKASPQFLFGKRLIAPQRAR